MFEDLVLSRPGRPGRGRARALPVSLAFHGIAAGVVILLPALTTELPPVQAGALTPGWDFPRVPVVAIASPQPPRVPPRRAPGTRRPTARSQAPAPVPAAGTGPAVPSTGSLLATDTIDPDAPALCFSDCTGGERVGVAMPGLPIGDEAVGDPPIRRAGRDVTPPAKLSGNPPVYPALAKQARIEGDVVIECTIDPSGRVVNATITQHVPLLDQAALDAVLGWRYRPTLVDGVPVPVLMTVTVRFRIR
jgi:protein TonB